jgi:Mrp family chromosome partitioning ATPase
MPDNGECEKSEDTCATCGENPTCKQADDLRAPAHKLSRVRNVIAVMSGKGGVGKSSVAALLAVMLARAGHRVGILDADLTGPSIPKMFGVTERVGEGDFGAYLPKSRVLGIYVLSANLLLEKEDDPIIWRGPIIANAVKQFWTGVAWGKLDYLIVDLPPGTGDVPLTVMQSLPLNGVLIVSSPQELTAMIVRKAVKMAGMMNVPVIGVIENMTYATCPKCGEKIFVFGAPRGQQVAEQNELELLASLPLDPELSKYCDTGRIEEYVSLALENLPQILDRHVKSSFKTARMLFGK